MLVDKKYRYLHMTQVYNKNQLFASTYYEKLKPILYVDPKRTRSSPMDFLQGFYRVIQDFKKKNGF